MTKQPNKLLLGIGVLALVLACLFKFVLSKTPGSITTDISSTLTDAINISELSTAEFRYRGIADIYNEKKTKVKCRVCYSAVVKAGIDMKDVKVENVDKDNKTITITLPDISLKVTIVDEQSMVTLPSGTNLTVATMLQSCKADAEEEAKQSQELMDTARENLKATVEGLALPILRPQGYTIIWK